MQLHACEPIPETGCKMRPLRQGAAASWEKRDSLQAQRVPKTQYLPSAGEKYRGQRALLKHRQLGNVWVPAGWISACQGLCSPRAEGAAGWGALGLLWMSHPSLCILPFPWQSQLHWSFCFWPTREGSRAASCSAFSSSRRPAAITPTRGGEQQQDP